MVKKAENRTFEAVIFDMDGVIFDTEHLAMNLWIQAFWSLLAGQVQEHGACAAGESQGLLGNAALLRGHRQAQSGE